MSTVRPHDSVASLAAMIGPLAAGHLERLARHVLQGAPDAGDPRFVRLITGEPHPLANLVVLARGDDLDAARDAIAPVQHAERPAAVACSTAEVAADVTALLAEHGFEPASPLPAMAADIGSLATTSLPAGHVLRRGHADDRAAWIRTLAEAYPFPARAAALFAPATLVDDRADAAPVQIFGVWRDGALAATSMLYLDSGVAGVYCVATRAEARGQGLGAHATAEPLRVAHRLGYRVGVLQSSEEGRSVYERLGFGTVAAVPLFVRSPAV